MMTQASMLKVKDLKVNYGGIEALKGISFDVEQGQIVTLIGANGAGKSTTLRAISGLVKTASGAINFMGRDIIPFNAQQVVAEGIADAAFNYTRFICISRKLEITQDAHKFSIMLSLPHRPGALNGIIAKFAAIDVNLTKLESRPIPGMDFEFRFTFDFEASPGSRDVLGLIAELSQDPEIEHFEFLGAYAERQ